jgi:hypothetical protein
VHDMSHHRPAGARGPQKGSSVPAADGSAARDELRRQARTLRVWALVVLVPVAVIGAVLSFRSLYERAVPVFGPRLALGFPLLVDFLILGASLQYVAGAKTGRPRAGWRWTAHAGVVGTLALNAMAAPSLAEVPWHVTAPAVWSVLVELSAREVLGQWRAVHAPVGDRIPLRLWLTAPVESARTWLRLARRVEGEQALARLDVGVHAAAVEALKLALPQRGARRVRRILRRQLRAGSLPPAAVLGPLGWMDDADALAEVTPQSVLRAALSGALRGTVTPAPVPPVGPSPVAPPPAPVPVPGPVETAPLTDAEPLIDGVSVAEADPVDRHDRVDHEPSEDEPVLIARASSGDRFSDAVDIVRVHESITATQLATQLRGLGWQLSDRTAARILVEVRAHLLQFDPWALPTP